LSSHCRDGPTRWGTHLIGNLLLGS